MHDERSSADLAGQVGAGPTLLAAFVRAEDAAAALGELLAAGFINVEQEVDGARTLLIVDAGDRQNQAREILVAHDGIEFDRPD